MWAKGAALIIGAIVLAVGGALAQTPAGRARQGAAPVVRAPAEHLRILGGDINSLTLQMVVDLARETEEPGGLRIVPVVGKGSFINIHDLIASKWADALVIQSDVLARYLSKNKQPGLENQIQYIAKLHSEEFHVLSKMKYLCLADLSGRRVSFGPRDSGMAITAEAIFEAHNISVEPLYLDHETALKKLIGGEIDALVYVGGKPSRAFDRITHKDHVHFLDVGYIAKLQHNYLPTVLVAEDYPNLIAPDETVATLSVSSVLAVYNWGQQTEKHRALAKFSEAFFKALPNLQQGALAGKWKEVNPSAPIKGLQRFPPAEKWLAANAQAANGQVAGAAALELATPQVKEMFQKFVESDRGRTTDKNELFNQFINWYRSQAPQP